LSIAFDEMVTPQGQHVPMPATIQAIRALPQPNSTASSYPEAGGNSAPTTSTGGMAGGGMSGGAGRPGGTPAGTGEYPNPNANAGSSSGTAPSETQAPLTGTTQGVIGMPDLSLSSANGASVITSDKKNVKLESGTQLLLHVGSK